MVIVVDGIIWVRVGIGDIVCGILNIEVGCEGWEREK